MSNFSLISCFTEAICPEYLPDGTMIKQSQRVEGDMLNHHLQPNRQRVLLKRQTERNKQTDRERGRLLAMACNVSAIGRCPTGWKCKGTSYSTEGGRHHGCCPCGVIGRRGERYGNRLGGGGGEEREREEIVGELLCWSCVLRKIIWEVVNISYLKSTLTLLIVTGSSTLKLQGRQMIVWNLWH